MSLDGKKYYPHLWMKKSGLREAKQPASGHTFNKGKNEEASQTATKSHAYIHPPSWLPLCLLRPLPRQKWKIGFYQISLPAFSLNGLSQA